MKITQEQINAVRANTDESIAALTNFADMLEYVPSHVDKLYKVLEFVRDLRAVHAQIEGKARDLLPENVKSFMQQSYALEDRLKEAYSRVVNSGSEYEMGCGLLELEVMTRED